MRSFPHVRVCLTSISTRLARLDKVVSSLLAQDYPAFDVILSLSSEPKMLDEGVTRIPDDLRALTAEPRFQIGYTTNHGPYRKLMPVLAGAWGQDALFATADDDTLYPEDWLARLVERYLRYRCVIAYRGHPILTQRDGYARYRRWMTTKPEGSTALKLLPTGKDGVLYNARFFHPAVLDIATATTIAPTTDDLWWRWHSAAVGVPVHLINLDYTTDTLPELDDGPSLYDSFNRSGENDRVIARLETYGRERLGFSFLGPVSGKSNQVEKRKSPSYRSDALRFAI
ncbi:MAG: glycosyltransferase family A protein [Pseudomonadota bacterium]